MDSDAPAFAPPSKIDETATVIANEKLAGELWRLILAAPRTGPRYQPGQFCQLRIHPGAYAPLLRRAFAVSESREDGFAFVYAIMGEGTKALSRLLPGAVVQALGPLGNTYTLPAEGPVKRALLIGGGTGVPSLAFLARTLRRRGVAVYAAIGARTAAMLVCQAEFASDSEKTLLATDDGSEGIHGHAVQAAETLLAEMDAGSEPVIYACGPRAMLKAAAALAEKRNLPCEVSLEERMACGFGVCLGCPVKCKSETNTDGFVYQRVCVEGPVFDGREIVW